MRPKLLRIKKVSPGAAISGGDLYDPLDLCFRLFTGLPSTVEPFAYVIRDHISHDGIEERNNLPHLLHPLP